MVRSWHSVQIAFHNATDSALHCVALHCVTCSFSKFTQNNVERKVNEFVKAHKKKLKLKALHSADPTNCKGRLQRTITSFSLPETEFLVCINFKLPERILLLTRDKSYAIPANEKWPARWVVQINISPFLNVKWYEFKTVNSFNKNQLRAFITPHFTYCSSIWNSCLKEDSDRSECLHKRALRYVKWLL